MDSVQNYDSYRRRLILPPESHCSIFGLLHQTDDVGSALAENFGKLLPDYTALYPKRYIYS
jgi:hypothetical protein